MPPSTDTPTVLWTLRHGHRRLECSVQLLRHGLELYLALNGKEPYCSRLFQTQAKSQCASEHPQEHAPTVRTRARDYKTQRNVR